MGSQKERIKNLAKLPEMNILNGKSTGRRPVMGVRNLSRKGSGDLLMLNLVNLAKLKFIMFFLVSQREGTVKPIIQWFSVSFFILLY